MHHDGSESYFVIGEGLLGRGRRPGGTLAAAVEAQAPPFSLFADGAEGVGRQLGQPNLRKIGRGDGGRRRRCVADSRRLHLPRSVRRSRPDLRPDQSDAGRERPAERAPAGALAEPRPRFALRGGSERPQVGQLLRGRRPPPEDGEGGCDRAASRRRTVSTSRAAPGTTAAKQRKAIIPDPAERREPRRRPDAPGHHPLPQPRRRHPPGSVPPSQRFAKAREKVDQALPVDAPHRLPAADLRAGRRQRRVQPAGARCSRSGCPRREVPTMPIEFSVAAFRLGHSMVRRPTTGTGSSTTARLRSICCSPSRRTAATSAADRGFRATGSPTSAGCTTSARRSSRTSPCRRGSSTGRCGSTRRWSIPLADLPGFPRRGGATWLSAT